MSLDLLSLDDAEPTHHNFKAITQTGLHQLCISYASELCIRLVNNEGQELKC